MGQVDLLVMNKKQDIWTDREEANKQLRYLASSRNCGVSDLLRAKARRPIINALASEHFAKGQLGMRQSSMRYRWAELVEL